MRAKVEAVCENCNRKYLKDESEIKRNLKVGRKNFCSLSCNAKYYHILDKYYGKHNENLSNFRDEYTGIRGYMRRAIKRSERMDCQFDITLEVLLNVWNIQNGKCIYTGIGLFHRDIPENKQRSALEIASLDRIDSSIGYVKNNIQFTSIMANWAKGKLTHSEMVEFCKQVAFFWNDKREGKLEPKSEDINDFKEYSRRVGMRPKEYTNKFKMSYDGVNDEKNVSVEDIIEQWNKQGGICQYSGVKLIHAKKRKNKEKNLMYIASLDRIDSNLGYIKGNIQFISALCNFAKNKLSHEQMIKFCQSIQEFWKDRI